MSDKLKIGRTLRKVFRMAAGTQQSATLGENNNGNSSNNGNPGSGDNGQNGDSNAGGNGNGTNGSNAANGSQEGANGGGNGNGGTNPNGSGNGSGENYSGNHGFDGDYDPARARTLIDTLREESRAKDRQLKEMRERLEKLEGGSGGGSGSTDTKNGSGSTDTDNAALEEIRKIRNELAEEKRLTRFQQLATGMHPDAISMAYATVKDEFDIDSNGAVTNMTTVIESLRQRQPFLFAPSTQGQNQAGSAGAGTHSAGGGKLYTEDEKAAMRAFNMTPEQFEAAKTGKPPVKS